MKLRDQEASERRFEKYVEGLASVIGRAFYVMEYMDGRVLWDQSLPGLDRAGRAAIYDEMNRVMAALHNVDFKAVGLAEYGKPGNYFDRQIGRWKARRRHIAQIGRACEPGDMWCRPRQRQALLHWAYDSRRI